MERSLRCIQDIINKSKKRSAEIGNNSNDDKKTTAITLPVIPKLDTNISFISARCLNTHQASSSQYCSSLPAVIPTTFTIHHQIMTIIITNVIFTILIPVITIRSKPEALQKFASELRRAKSSYARIFQAKSTTRNRNLQGSRF